MSDLAKPGDVLKDLVELIGAEVAVSAEEAEQIFKAGLPHALRTQFDIMTAGANERVRAYIAKEWTDRVMGTPIQRVAAAVKVQLDDRTLEALARIAAEDDRDAGVCEAVDAEVARGEGPGADQGEPAGAIEA